MTSRSPDERSGTSDASIEGSAERSTPEGSPISKSAASAADQRRARHRKVVKQSYYRKLVGPAPWHGRRMHTRPCLSVWLHVGLESPCVGPKCTSRSHAIGSIVGIMRDKGGVD